MIYYRANKFIFDEPTLWPLEVGMWLGSLDTDGRASVAHILVMRPERAKSIPTNEAARRLDELARRLSDAGIELADVVVQVKVESNVVGKGEETCCESGQCHQQERRRSKAVYAVHYANPMQLKDIIWKEAAAEF